MTAGILRHLVRTANPITAAQPELCKRARFRGSTCRICADICPEDAISFGPGPRIGESCSDCGLCVNACPTEAFTDSWYSAANLLARAEAPRTGSASSPDRSLAIRCRQAEPTNHHSISLPCLGSLSENVLVGAALTGFTEILLTTGVCSECPLREGARLLSISMRRTSTLLESLGLETTRVSLGESEKRKDTPIARRGLFTGIANAMGRYAAPLPGEEKLEPIAAVDGKSAAKACEPGAQGSPKRRQLLQLLQLPTARPIRPGSSVEYDRTLPWANLTIDAGQCSLCYLCVEICPTDAIGRTDDEEHVTFSFQAAACTNCTLCEEACPEKAIGFEDTIDPGRLLAAEPVAVTRVAQTWCRVCGETLPVREGRICSTCSKRQLQPPSASTRRGARKGDGPATF